ncbi:MAG: Ribonuclease, partial [Planctomycetota bacterium]
MDSDNLNGPTDGAPNDGGYNPHGREKHAHEASLPPMDRIDGEREDADGDSMNIEVPGEPEFLDDPGSGFGFADADETADEQAAETEGAPDLSPEELAELEAEAAEARADAEEAAAAYARASMVAFEAPAETVEPEADDPLVTHRGEKPKQLVIVNDVPGDETRIAILEQGKLVQFFSERAATSTNVGSIYKARVVNVEPAIQAAFVDFGEGANGFLHISDLHPKYFPANRGDSEKSVEKVGKKIPRRARPLIQDALKRGMEITVQVLKEGLGSKGPTVTSYLSIPGRLLVMMPDMDNVGVSRKVDDEDSRRKMRKILDSLNLPEGFGFILRTAGFDATRTELARDAQYLTRLWSVMAKRMDAVGAPCQLYTEGDILLRTIRDSIDVSVDGIVCDSESSFHRAKAFLEVVSPRTATKVHFWDRRMPVFHAFDVERQVDMIHAREVPLPSGGALVIDQAEALVAIDVNSGRSRSARDSETNAYQTNQEAVDEIARQLRLRDLGGVIVNDLIDMRSVKHRREIEDRLKKHFQKDRAKTTVSQISEFGIVEMTRQRMRPSLRKTHYMECPHCQGLGEIRMPDTVASDAIRRIQYTLDMQQVARIEVVCSAKVAAVLLSKKRRTLVELEDLFGKKIAVRISDAIAVDRVDLYAYDERNADVELDRPQRLQIPALSSLPTDIEEDEAPGTTEQRGEGGGRRRRRRRRKPAAADATSMILSGGFEDLPDLVEDEPSISEAIDAEEEAERAAAEAAERADEDSDDDDSSADGSDQGSERRAEGEGGGRRRRRRRRGRGGRDRDGEPR